MTKHKTTWPTSRVRGRPTARNGFALTAADPSPAEEAAARAREAEEQAALPYKWQQTIADVDVTFNVPGNMKSRDLVVEIKKQTLSAGIRGQDTVIKVTRPSPGSRPRPV